ncbi:AT-rich interactive domain-containing protein 2 isoform X2 [Dendroctonus ponderosae]|uniref:AT-rich interactive domain-containing protein 2 isoform X2 n=1 Tax=Dendroctonus ponderosae TaxID=77166 RepID=UPI0020355526|nr:AT-rich interactive domain-containing protein 2 isoform X2 [Dendroctonus ponderosae]
MAEILGKDEATYSKEKAGFLRDLRHFHEVRGTPFKRCPTLGGKEIDLYLLYSLVTAEGGWVKVNAKHSWNNYWQHFKLPLSVNGCVALKQIYLRFLDRWEKVYFLGEDGDRGSDDDEESRHKRWSARVLHATPHSYVYSQHNVSDEKRELHHLDLNTYRSSDYDKLALSLISPLPNEQDFAINVCTLLSNDNRHNLKLDRHPRIVTYLLAHAGIFSHSSLRQLFVQVYNDVRKKPIHNFWNDVLESDEFLDLTNETNFYTPKEEAKPCDTLIKDDSLQYADLDSVDANTERLPKNLRETRDADCECELVEDSLKPPKYFKFKSDASDKELFCLRRTLGTQDYVGQRVLQVATILRNLCFVEDNVSVLTRNSAFIRFLLLCSCSQWSSLKNLGFDMLGNIAADLELKDGQTDIIGTSILKIISRNLQSDDRASCLSSVEVLNKLSQNEKNEDILIRCLESGVYKKVCSFLTIHDVMLLIYTLECLYSLSSLGERSCNFIANNHGVIDTLVSLVTVEGKSYGPKACIGMKLVETIPSGSQLQTQSQTSQQQSSQSTAAATPQQSASTTTTATNTIIVSSTITSMASSPPAPGVTPVKVVSNLPNSPIKSVIPLTPQRLLVTATTAPPMKTETMIVMSTKSTATVAPTVTTTTPLVPAPQVMPSLTPQQLIQQQHAHQQAIQENEQFALAWLRATYEPCGSGNKVDHQELYKHYISSCTKIGRRGVISPLHFPRCVRSVFGGTVGPNPMKPANPNDPQYYEGIKVRAQPLKLNIPPPLSPPKSIFTPSPAPKSTVRRKQKTAAAPTKSGTNAPLAVDAESDGSLNILSPASPILKAQLSAPPKPRESSSASSTLIAPSDSKSQAMAHPHLSHALLGSTTSSSSSTMSSMATSVTTTTKAELKQDPQVIHAGQSNSSSLIKSLLATKVNDACLSTVSMKAASTDCQNVAQVAARQQRLLSQQNAASTDGTPKNQSRLDALKMHRINGVRQLFTDNEVGDPSVSSTTQFITISKGKKEPPQPPPPPLAPFSNNLKSKTPPIINEDSDSLGNHSLSSTSGVGAIGVVSSTEENDNSLTSFEGLLNGMPIVEETLNESSNSKDSLKISGSEISIDKPLRLADLLEKKFDKSPILNGTLNKDLKLENERSELLENHIEKALSRDNNELKMEDLKVDANSVKAEDNSTDADSAKRETQEGSFPDMKSETGDNKQGVKRHATDSIVEVDAKRPHLSANANGRGNICHTPDTSSTSRDERPTSVSTAAAKLFADFAADILEDEDEEQLMQQTQTATPAVVESGMSQQLIVDNNQQVLLSQPRQIIVSQPQIHTSNQSVVFSSGTPIKTASGQTVIVNAGVQQRQSVLIQPTNTGQLLLSQGLQGQVQLLQSNQAGQYVIQTNPSQGYMVAQSQTAVVHGQPQTVLVAQQGQSVGSKTIIILQQQPSGSASHHQKVMVTPQGQQVVVTQVPRPITQSSTSKSARPTPTPSPALSTASTSSLSNGVKEKLEEIPPKPKIIRDLTTPFVCEWGECVIDVKFKSANQVYMHACEEHCPQGDEEVICQWDRCDLLKRKRFSLMTHLHDKHCNVEAMKQSLVRRKKISQGINVEPPASSPTSHPGYAPDAALHAIKRHALDFVNPKELQDDNEGPVTKSIRLTASLILRNLAIYSSNCKRYLKSYESHLANIALSNVESSRTIAQILYDINDGTTHR